VAPIPLNAWFGQWFIFHNAFPRYGKLSSLKSFETPFSSYPYENMDITITEGLYFPYVVMPQQLTSLNGQFSKCRPLTYGPNVSKMVHRGMFDPPGEEDKVPGDLTPPTAIRTEQVPDYYDKPAHPEERRNSASNNWPKVTAPAEPNFALPDDPQDPAAATHPTVTLPAGYGSLLGNQLVTLGGTIKNDAKWAAINKKGDLVLDNGQTFKLQLQRGDESSREGQPWSRGSARGSSPNINENAVNGQRSTSNPENLDAHNGYKGQGIDAPDHGISDSEAENGDLDKTSGAKGDESSNIGSDSLLLRPLKVFVELHTLLEDSTQIKAKKSNGNKPVRDETLTKWLISIFGLLVLRYSILS